MCGIWLYLPDFVEKSEGEQVQVDLARCSQVLLLSLHQQSLSTEWLTLQWVELNSLISQVHF